MNNEQIRGIEKFCLFWIILSSMGIWTIYYNYSNEYDLYLYWLMIIVDFISLIVFVLVGKKEVRK